MKNLTLLSFVVVTVIASNRAEWMVSTLAGSGKTGLHGLKPCREDPASRTDGPAKSSRFAAPTRAQVFNNTVYVMDGMNGCIRSIVNGIVSSFTPCCTADIATDLGGNGPQDMHITDDYIYLMDSYNNQLKRSPHPFTKWTVLAGNGSRPTKGQSRDGPALQQALNEPHGMAVTSDGSGDVYIAETWSSCIRLLRNGSLTTIAGRCGTGGHANGAPLDARFQHPHHINLDPRNESELYVSDVECWDDDPYPDDQKFKPCASTDGGVCFSGIRKIELDRRTGLAIRVITVAGQVTERGGKVSKDCNDYADGHAEKAFFDYIHGTAFRPLSKIEIALQNTGHLLGGSDAIYICDEDNNMIRKLDLRTSMVTTLAGTGEDGEKDGPGSQATFDYPGGLGLDPHGNIYVGDYEANRVRMITPPKLLTSTTPIIRPITTHVHHRLHRLHHHQHRQQ